MHARIEKITYHLPEARHTSEDLHREYPDWSVEKIEKKTGIRSRHIAAEGECASDLATAAAEKLFATGVCQREDIDYVVFCTQSPDYFLPTSACLIQDRLGIPTSAGAIDFNQGCSGYVYGLGLAKGLIESGQCRRVLLLTGETYSKYLRADDRSVRTIFGDGASATLVGVGDQPSLGPFVYGTDGSGANNLIVERGGARNPGLSEPNTLAMNGAEIFTFTLQSVPSAVDALLGRAQATLDEIDLVVFHQANRYMMNHLRRKLKIPKEKFVYCLEEMGNTVSATIPIALAASAEAETLKAGANVMLVGFGVGYSWGATMVRWTPSE